MNAVFRIFKCAGGKDGEPQYLVAHPSMECYSGTHAQLLPIGALGFAAYGVIYPAIIIYILLVKVCCCSVL